MAEPTVTRESLRRLLCHHLRMPFFRRFPSYSTVTSAGSDLVDTALTQAVDYWNGQWVYVTSGANLGDMRYITDYDLTTHKLTVERPFTGAFVIGDKYEIHSIFNANEMHNALNTAMDAAFPAFYDSVVDSSLVILENKLTYDLTALTSLPWKIFSVWRERVTNVERSTVTSAASTTLVDSSKTFSTVTTDYYVSIYEGKGVGQIRQVTGIPTPGTLSVAAWTTTPDTTSKYALWNPAKEQLLWERVFNARFDSKEFPSTLWLSATYPESLGLRIRLQYVARCSPLTLDSQSTVVPQEYVMGLALEQLYLSMMNDNRADRQRYKDLAEDFKKRSEDYRRFHAFQPPDTTVWLDAETNGVPSENPMEWNR
jgi:hypothetical protein